MISRLSSANKENEASVAFSRNEDLGEKSFLDPGKLRWHFTLRSRKRRRVSDHFDSVSVHQLDLRSADGTKRKRLPRVSSLASILSTPARPVMKVGEALQRTWSGVKLSSSPVAIANQCPPSESLPASPSSSPGKNGSFSPPKRGQPAPTRQRRSRLWTQTVAAEMVSQNLPDTEIQRQEAIFELYQGEEDMVEDLHLVKTAYYDSLWHLNIMTTRELQDIFGSMHTLMPLHQDLVDKLKRLRNDDGTTDSIGAVLIEWIPGVAQYIAYCANQVHAKALLDEKKMHDKRLEDFLQRCLESPFSRRLDLWNFLDVPRNRLVKYPLLFKNILRLTPKGHPDETLIAAAVTKIEDVIRKVDEKTGEAESRLIVGKLDYLEERQKDPLIASSSVLLCSGILRNTRGTKLSVFLFNGILVLTRPASRDHGLAYQVYRQPIPACQLVVEDLKDGEVKMGSFRNAFSHNQTAKNLFRVSFRDPSLGQSHTLQANDSHDKKQWLHNLMKVSSGSGSSCPPVILPLPNCVAHSAPPSPTSLASSTVTTSTSSVVAATTALLTACHQHHHHNNNNNNNNDKNALNLESGSSSSNSSTSSSPKNSVCSGPEQGAPLSVPRILRKRSSENNLQVQSLEAACRGSLSCIFTSETRHHNGHSATTLYV